MKKSLEKNPKTTDEKIDYIISLIGTLATKDELNELNGKVDSVTKNTDKKIDQVISLIGTLATKDELNSLAIMTANSFAHQDKELAVIKDRVTTLEEVVKNTRQDVLNIGDKFVSRVEFDSHLVQFGRLDKKFNEHMSQ